MQYIKNLFNKYFKKTIISPRLKNKETPIDADTVYCFKVEVPSQEYELLIYAYNELDALYQTVRIMRLIDIPKDINVTAYKEPISSKYWNNYIFRNKQQHIYNIKDYSY
jgi:hypothetical protein